MEINLVLTEDEARDFLAWRHSRQKAVKLKEARQITDGKLISWVGNNMRLRNCLLNARLFEPEHIIGKTQNDLLRYRNFGKKSLRELCKILGEHGIILDLTLSAVNPVFTFAKKEVK